MTGNYILLLLLFVLLPGRWKPEASFEKQTGECIECHGEMIKEPVIHPELESTCDICHASTGEDHPKPDVKGFSLAESLPLLCFNCHSDFQNNIDTYATVHGSVIDSKSCINCHNPHSSKQSSLLVDGTNNLCLRCHNKTIVTDISRIGNINQVLTRAKSVHSPVEGGGCVTCHNPHYSEKKSLLVGNFPSGLYTEATTENFELCFLCHDTDLLGSISTESGTNFRDGLTNLHFIHINGDKGRNCTMCHDIHGAAGDRLIRDRVVFGRWEMKIDFELSENGGACLTACHAKKIYDRTLAIEK